MGLRGLLADRSGEKIRKQKRKADHEKIDRVRGRERKIEISKKQMPKSAHKHDHD
jgi:hypothetical protein